MSSSLIVENAKVHFPSQPILPYQTFVGLFCLAITLYFLLRRDPRLKYHLKQLGGPPSYPLIGNALSFICPHHEIRSLFDKWVNKYGTVFCLWLGNFQSFVFIAEPDVIEKVLSSTVHIEKGKIEYGLLYDWLGWGLVTAPRRLFKQDYKYVIGVLEHKWVHTRKLLTPAFHFKILNNFLPIFNNQASILLKCLERDSRIDGEIFDMSPYFIKLTTDIICESAMGKKLNAQTNSFNQKYSDAVSNYTVLVFEKIIKPWLRIPLFYNLTSAYKVEKEYLLTLKELAEQVIHSRKFERRQKNIYNKNNNLGEKDDQATTFCNHIFPGKRNRAFLDILLDTSENNPDTFTEKNIEEEVATFMFAGHDTTAVLFTWAFHLLANHPECQQKLQQELDEIFSDDLSRDVTLSDLAEMKYLECCIKEILRIYPIVPQVLRQVESDIVLKNGKIIPKGTTALISIWFTHRHPNYYEDPEAFKPERWFEITAKRHPYSYIPFSAGMTLLKPFPFPIFHVVPCNEFGNLILKGPRNCIGQKYALMEAKVALAKLFRSYWIEPVDKLDTLRLIPHIVLKCSDGVRVKLHKRKIS